MDSTAIINMTSQQMALRQRVNGLKLALNKHLKSIEKDQLKFSRFTDMLNQLEVFLVDTQTTLCDEDPNKSADEQQLRARLQQFKDVAFQFSDRSPNLDSLNDMGYRLALPHREAEKLQQLNHQWQTLHADTNDRCRTMQGFLLTHQDFNSKCEEWMMFLAKVEKDLAADIAGNYIGLLDQQRAFEV